MSFQVTDVTEQNEDVRVTFSDGYVAVFEPYSHGFGYQVEGLRCFRLYLGNDEVAVYDARLHREGPREDEHKLRHLDESCTLETVVAHWQAAREYIHEEYFEKPYQGGLEHPKELWYPWKLTREGWQDIAELQEQLSGA